ncbi:MAG: DUF4365 domain-containing protein [Lachnospiraceae bacterium]|nr:DUF4365 domain-containing protein [Lachnospiraceae bacterium]
MDKAKIKEDLSVCYLRAVSAVNGIAFERIEHDEDSVDCILKKFIVDEMEGRFNSMISVQLKATSSPSQYTISKDKIAYRLKVKNYNDLCELAAVPGILALLILPEREDEWVKWTTEELLLRGRMYWLSLQGKDKSTNKDWVTVQIPVNNVLNAATVNELLKRAAEEGCL